LVVAVAAAIGVLVLAFNPTASRAGHVSYSEGDVFAGVGTGLIKHFDSAGTLLETLDTATGCSEDLGMAFDSGGNLYATASFGSCSGNGQVVKFDNQGGLIGPFGSGYGSSTESIAIDAADNVYVGQPDGTGDILKFDSDGNPLASYDVAVGPRGSDWIDLAADQCTMFYTSEGSSVKRFDVCTDTQLADFATGLSSPCFALRIRENGEVLVTCITQTFRLNPDGSVNTSYPISGEFLFAMNLDADGAHFWTSGRSSGNVYKVNIDTGSGTAAPLFNAGIVGCCLSGLAIFGEPTVAKPQEPTITLDPPSATNVVGSDHTVTATVVIDGQADVEFNVTDGPNAGDTGSDSTDGNGEATFTYTGDGGAGTDTIEACVVDFPELCTTATKTWVVEPTPTPTPTPTPLAATATPTPTPAVVEVVQLPATGGAPSDGGSSALPWLAAIVGVIALIGSGSAWFARQRRRVR
jgi:hypothetical protein